MTQPFFKRLSDYFLEVGQVLRGEANAASVFPNASDIGTTREQVYVDFLRSHLPSNCNVFLGGFLFNLRGEESRQIDVIVTGDVCPQYNFYKPNSTGRSFSCIEGTLAVATLKSKLDSMRLIDCLNNLASIPSKEPLGNRKMPFFNISNYGDWPFKIIYASDGMNIDTTVKMLRKYYEENNSIPCSRRPNLIHVAGKYNIVRIIGLDIKNDDGTPIPKGTFHGSTHEPDLGGLVYAVQEIQKISMSSRYILFRYGDILSNAMLISLSS